MLDGDITQGLVALSKPPSEGMDKERGSGEDTPFLSLPQILQEYELNTVYVVLSIW